MTNQIRRQFLKNAAMGAAAIEGGTRSAAGRARAASQQKRPATIAPDLVLLNGRIYTVDDRLPKAEAFAVKQGRFVAVGTTDQI